MKFLVLFVAMAGFVPGLGETSFAQGEDPDCLCQCICLTDNSCTDQQGSCNTLTGCEVLEFTAQCTWTYTLDLKLNNSNCDDCLACAQIYTAGGGFVTSVQAGCNGICSGSGTVALTQGVTYKFYVCMRACAGAACTDCTGGSAFARLYCVLGECSAPCN